MIKIMIDSIEAGASYEGTIFDYWIYASLDNMKAITIFDSKPINLSDYIGKRIVCLVELFGVEIGNNDSVEMEYLGLNQKINTEKVAIDENEYHRFKNETGIYYVKDNEIMEISLEVGKKYSFTVDRYDLIAIA